MKRIKLPAATVFAFVAIVVFVASALGYFDPAPHEHVLPHGNINLEQTFMEKYNAQTPAQKEAFDREIDRIREKMIRDDSNPRKLVFPK